MLKHFTPRVLGIGLILSFLPSLASAQTTQPANAIKALHDRVKDSFVAVQWTWAYEWGRAEYVGAGVVVRADGLIAIPMQVADPGIPDSQMTDFKIIIPDTDDKDEQEIEAVFQGRDERSDLAYVKPKDSSARKWSAIKFVDHRAEVGDRLRSIGMLPKMGGYQTYITSGIAAAHFRGEIHNVAVTAGELANVGGVVFNDSDEAVGYINVQQNVLHLLNATSGEEAEVFQSPASVLVPLENHPCFYVPAKDVLISVTDPPTPDHPMEYPWVGASLTGLEKDVAEEFGLTNQPAIEISDIVPNGPFDKAGLKLGMKIVKIDGQPLERGDLPTELGGIVTRKVQRMKVGSVITVSVLTEKDKPLQDFKVTLEKRPVRQNEMPRFWAEDLAFSVRDLSFHDLYTRKQPTDLKGVMVALVKGDGPAANAQLADEDIVTTLNGTAIKDRENFKSEYEKLRSSKPKEAIVLVVIKQDGQTQTVRIEPPQ